MEPGMTPLRLTVAQALVRFLAVWSRSLARIARTDAPYAFRGCRGRDP